MSEIEDRRQRAREAFYDAYADGTFAEVRGVEEAIEVATQVTITPEMINAYSAAASSPNPQGARGRLVAVFRAAGFEVIE